MQPKPVPSPEDAEDRKKKGERVENMTNVKEISERLSALIADEVKGDLRLFCYLYGEKPVVPLKLEEIKDFSFWDNGQNVLIYEGNQCIYNCCYDKFYGLKRLTHCYYKNKLIIKFEN